MRKSTKNAVGVISLGILGLSYQLGTTATASTGGFASPSGSAIPIAQGSSSPSSTSKASPSASSTKSTPSKSKPAASASASTSPSPSASQAAPSAASVTKVGDTIESGFGPVQVKVTKVSGKITTITMLQAVASNGRAQAFPYLVQYAIQANGSNFGNLSGATYTTNAFKQSLESALAKF